MASGASGQTASGRKHPGSRDPLRSICGIAYKHSAAVGGRISRQARLIQGGHANGKEIFEEGSETDRREDTAPQVIVSIRIVFTDHFYACGFARVAGHGRPKQAECVGGGTPNGPKEAEARKEAGRNQDARAEGKRRHVGWHSMPWTEPPSKGGVPWISIPGRKYIWRTRHGKETVEESQEALWHQDSRWQKNP